MNLRLLKTRLLPVIFMTACAAHAQSDLGKGLQFGAGVFASIYVHEIGHAVVAKALGAEDVEIDIPRKGDSCIFLRRNEIKVS